MCVLSDVVLSGFPLKSTLSSLPNPMFATNGARSEMVLVSSRSRSRLVKPDSGEMSEIKFSLSSSLVRLVIPDSAETSEYQVGGYTVVNNLPL